jgi:hypothetical protein
MADFRATGFPLVNHWEFRMAGGDPLYNPDRPVEKLSVDLDRREDLLREQQESHDYKSF